ncbi:MAG TPA: tetratricopeptide repeat protein [Kiritimatiellia bacterium]|nr:tetratricopeptide repeat protein [Kiritimatiellia bacterium]HMP35480.1 tetratricopeptide repeat protein [Kiritimatiellia bacterium]
MKHWSRFTGIIIAFAALVAYISLLPDFLFPNEWSSALYSILGMDPFRPLTRPVWQFLMSTLGGLPGSRILPAAHLLSAFWGALCVGLMYLVALRLRRAPVLSVTSAGLEQVQRTRRVSAMASAGFLAVSAPLLIVATRIHPYGFNLALLLTALWLTLRFRDEPTLATWLGFATVYGIGIAEYPTFILLAPVFLTVWIWLFWRSKRAPARWIAPGVLLGLAGVAVGLLFAWRYAAMPVAEWREFDSVWTVYHYFLIEQYQQIRYSVPKTGWLIVLLTMVLPGLYVWWNGFEDADDLFTNLGHIALRLILLGVAVVLLYNLPGSPWRVMGPHTVLVTPYAITALWFGQLVGFFYHQWTRPLTERGRARGRTRSPVPARILLVALVAMLGSAGYLNATKTSPAKAAPLVRAADNVLDGMGDRAYLISNGMLDGVMQWRAVAEQRNVRFINRTRGNSRAYLRFMNSWIRHPDVEAMVEAGFAPYLDVWMSITTNLPGQLAVQDIPELWTMQGFRWLPVQGFYAGYDPETLSTEERDRLLQQAVAYVENNLADFRHGTPRPELLREAYRLLSRQLAVFANNLGYTLAGLDRSADARAAYEAALAFQPDNVSALINLADLARTEGREDEAKSLQESFERILREQSIPAEPRVLAMLYGHLRNNVLFLQEGVALMQAGMTESGIETLRRAVTDLPGGHQSEILLAQALFEGGQIPASLEAFRAVAESDPANTAAWLGLARSQTVLRQTNEAAATFARLADMGLAPELIDVELGFLMLAMNNHAEAVQRFGRHLDRETVAGPAAVGMMWAAGRIGDQAALARAVRVLDQMPNYYAGQMALYEWAMRTRDLIKARECLTQARRIQPGNTDALEKYIRLELMEGREATAKLALDQLLALDSSHPFGNYLLSGIHQKNGRLDLAETALRRALSRDTSGEASYGLSWVLAQQGRHEEALRLIDQALKRQPGNPSFLGTRGVILNGLEQWPEAERQLQAAIAQTPSDIPLFRAHHALAISRQDRNPQARELVADLLADDQTDPELQAVLDRLEHER